MYAVVAPGLSCVYTNWEEVKRVAAIYPYPKWCKCNSQQEAAAWIKRNAYGHTLSRVYNYGNTFEDLYVYVKYKIHENSVYYVLDCSRVGNIRIHAKNTIVQYKGSKIYVELQNTYLSDSAIAGHMSAIYNILQILGDYIDVNIELPYYCLYYCLVSYNNGRSRPIEVVKAAISERLGAVAYSLYLDNFSKEKEV